MVGIFLCSVVICNSLHNRRDRMTRVLQIFMVLVCRFIFVEWRTHARSSRESFEDACANVREPDRNVRKHIMFTRKRYEYAMAPAVVKIIELKGGGR